jgi:hypothetical protein
MKAKTVNTGTEGVDQQARLHQRCNLMAEGIWQMTPLDGRTCAWIARISMLIAWGQESELKAMYREMMPIYWGER